MYYIFVMMCYIEFWIMYMYYRVGYFSGTFVYLDYVHTLLFIFASIVILKHFPKFASNYVLGHFLVAVNCVLGRSQSAPKSFLGQFSNCP
jgi:hypothetical protein